MTGRLSLRRWLGLASVVALLAGCGGPILANPPAAHPIVTPTPAVSAAAGDPRPISLPADDAPHDRLTEWWYYTGHLVDAEGGHWGFEMVVFQAHRGDFPVSWASHLALTDESGDAFHYAQRSEIGPQADVRAATPGSAFAFAIRGGDPTDPASAARSPWTMTGADGHDHLAATALPAEVQGSNVSGFGIDLQLEATRPPVLHDGDGWIDFGPAGGSYYVSRTSMTATGKLTVGGRSMTVRGTAWFDHQWGDFISVGAGGWDWFAINLADGSAIMLSEVRAADGSYPLVYGTLQAADGSTRHLARDAFTVAVDGTWTSPRTGATYPAAWTVTIPAEGLVIQLRPTVAQQELDTRATTGVVYWEGSQLVSATRAGHPLGGEAYVELTGYARP